MKTPTHEGIGTEEFGPLPPKFFTQQREAVAAELALPSAQDIALLNERKVLALEDMAKSLRQIAFGNADTKKAGSV